MATGDGITVKLENTEPIEGADRIVQAKLLGETVIVGKDSPEGTLGILFDMETRLMPEFLRENNLFRHSELNIDPTIKGYFEDNGRVRPIRLKGIKVSAFWIPVTSLDYIIDTSTLKEGDIIHTIAGHKICEKYLPPQKGVQVPGQKKLRVILSEMFKEHFDTDHLLRNLRDVPEGYRFVITKKLHGTSARYGKLLVNRPLKWYEKLWAKVIDYKPQTWANIVGSRTVVKSVEGIWNNPNDGYYKSDIWTRVSHEVFGDKLLKGETVYFEIVGYDKDESIMPPASCNELSKILSKDEYKRFVEEFGEKIEYNYGVPKGEYDVYVYRITHTTIDGVSIDLSWEQLKVRCEKLGVKHVPEIYYGERYLQRGTREKMWFIDDLHYRDSRDFSEKIEEIAASAHHNGTHAEGICLRVDTYPTCKIWKHKCQNFKIMEFGLRDEGVVTLEEQEAVI